MSARARTPRASCARYYNHENGEARRMTRRAHRRASRAWVRAALMGAADAVPAPLPARTEGHLTH